MTTVAAESNCSKAEGGSRILSPWRVEAGVFATDSWDVHFRTCFDSVMVVHIRMKTTNRDMVDVEIGRW